LSDDDIPLDGVVEELIKRIQKHNPLLIYLNHAGYSEGEPYNVVLQRNSDLEDIIYDDPEELIEKHIVNHLSSMVCVRESALKHKHVVEEYKRMEFERGYSLAIFQYAILKERGKILVFMGKLCLAVRNPRDGNKYNPLIDTAKHYDRLCSAGLISKRKEHNILNWFLRGFYTLVLPRKCNRDPDYNKKIRNQIYKYCMKYKNFWLYMFPFLILPRWVLYLPYIIGREILRMRRKRALQEKSKIGMLKI
jgi:hypothetical protein